MVSIKNRKPISSMTWSNFTVSHKPVSLQVAMPLVTRLAERPPVVLPKPDAIPR